MKVINNTFLDMKLTRQNVWDKKHNSEKTKNMFSITFFVN